jgi:hypothetical protein
VNPKRKFMAWSAAAVAGLVPVLVTPSAAHAAWEDCPANAFCMWDYPNGQGRMIWVPVNSGDQPDLRAWDFDDKMSSVANTSTRGFCLYPDLNYDGDWHAFVPPNTLANIVDVDNTVTSVRWAPSTSPPAC